MSENAEEAKEVLTPSNKSMVIDGYPTIYLIKNGEINYYQGERTENAILNWLSNYERLYR